MIADYSDLIAEVSQRSGISDVASRAAMLTGMAEGYLSRAMRTSEMETTATLTTDANGDVALPTDYQSPRAVLVGNCVLEKRPLEQIKADNREGYYIQGSTLHSSKASQDITFHYYQALPSLDANSTNWLLSAAPEIYLQAVLFQAFVAANELEKAQATSAFLASLISDYQRIDNVGRFAGVNIGRQKVSL